MKAVKLVVATAVSAIAFALYSSSIAQQVTGELGSPSATTTISGKQLPPPDPSFGGVIRRRLRSRRRGGHRASCRRRVSRIEGLFSFGQYVRSISRNLPAGAGSQFDSLSARHDEQYVGGTGRGRFRRRRR